MILMKRQNKKPQNKHFQLFSTRSILISFLSTAAIYLLGLACTYPIEDMRYSCIAKITGTEMNHYFLGANIIKWTVLVLLAYFVVGISFRSVVFALRKMKK